MESVNKLLIVFAFEIMIVMIFLMYLCMLVYSDRIVAFKNNWRKILSGMFYSIFTPARVRKIAADRLEICKSNKCGFYDPKGENEICYVPGKACCAACGCNNKWKRHSLSSDCGLTNLGQEPLWTAVMSYEEELKFQEKTGYQNKN